MLDKNLRDFDDCFSDGRMTVPSSDTQDYDFRKAVAEVERLGRPLTEEEFDKYRFKN